MLLRGALHKRLGYLALFDYAILARHGAPVLWVHEAAELVPGKEDAGGVVGSGEKVVLLVTEGDDLGPDNVAWPEARCDLDLVLLCGANVGRPDHTLEVVKQGSIADGYNLAGRLQTVGPRDPSEYNRADLRQDDRALRLFQVVAMGASPRAYHRDLIGGDVDGAELGRADVCAADECAWSWSVGLCVSEDISDGSVFQHDLSHGTPREGVLCVLLLSRRLTWSPATA